jgi:hypothetical protein
MKRKFIEFIWIYAVVSVLYGLFALLLFFPFHPITAIGWVVWFVAALPISMAGEAVGSAAFNKKTGVAINPDTEQVSAGRIGYGVIVALMFIFIILFVVSLLGAAGGDFWDTNFSSDW